MPPLLRSAQHEASSGGGGGGGGGGGDNIKVVARIRPLFPSEVAKGATGVVQVAEDGGSMKVSRRGRAHACAAGPAPRARSAAWGFGVGLQHAAAPPGTHRRLVVVNQCSISRALSCMSQRGPPRCLAPEKVVVPGPGGASLSREFGFHACLGPDTTQAEVLELCGITQLLDAALAGYHVTIFAYGQTGALFLRFGAWTRVGLRPAPGRALSSAGAARWWQFLDRDGTGQLTATAGGGCKLLIAVENMLQTNRPKPHPSKAPARRTRCRGGRRRSTTTPTPAPTPTTASSPAACATSSTRCARASGGGAGFLSHVVELDGGARGAFAG